jgi:pimeloyl-ACP methyl ester carboxylesterase
VHGWPETWYAWRLLMPALARDFEVIAVDQRGMGLSEKPEGGYDTGTHAGDLVALMDALGHERFAVVGHDTGFGISYALARRSPGPGRPRGLPPDHRIPGNGSGTPLFLPGPLIDRLWHLGFNRIEKLNEQLVAGREDTFYRWEFDAAAKSLPDDVIKYYVRMFSNPDSRAAASGGTGLSIRPSRRTSSARPGR